MKVQSINNSYRNVNTNNTNRRDVNFGWGGGPVEPISTTSKHCISIKEFVCYIKSFISLIKDCILNKDLWISK